MLIVDCRLIPFMGDIVDVFRNLLSMVKIWALVDLDRMDKLLYNLHLVHTPSFYLQRAILLLSKCRESRPLHSKKIWKIPCKWLILLFNPSLTYLQEEIYNFWICFSFSWKIWFGSSPPPQKQRLVSLKFSDSNKFVNKSK